MSTPTPIELEGDVELKGKEFDEVCELIKDKTEITGAVHKRPDGAGRWSYCFGFQASEYTEADLLALLSAEYGPGDYPVQFKSKGKTGRQVIRWQKHMHVQARRLGATQNSTPTAAPASGSDGLTATLMSIADTQVRMLDALAKLSEQDPVEQKTTIDFVKELGAIKDLFSDNRQSALEQFKDAMELRKLIKDDDDDGGSDPLSIALRTLTPAIEKGVAALQESEAAQVRRPDPPATATQHGKPVDVAARPLSDVEVQANVDQVTEENIVYAYQLFAEQFLPSVLQLAESGEDPEHVAAYLVRLVGTDQKTIDLVGLVIMQDDMVLRFAKANARVLQFTAWLDLVADYLAHALWPATNPKPEPLNATIDATIDESASDGVINDAELTGAESADTIASGESIPDAESDPDAPRTGDDNDA
ncbi:hypothetical protein LCGC14_0639720 [marine sediment metagenome]|uniref:Uncharacterized protein n=1 Tax=marine sediment metagenome TaxID=412755 RepID=A0A0F9RIU7_9ZZZZ